MLTKRARHGGRRTRVPTLSWIPYFLSFFLFLFLSLSQLPRSREDNFFSYLFLPSSSIYFHFFVSHFLSPSRPFLFSPLFIDGFFFFFFCRSLVLLLARPFPPPRFARSSVLPLITGRGRRASKRNPVRTVVVPCGRTWIIVGCYRDTECTGWWTGLETTTTVRHRHGSWGGCWFRRKGEPVRPIGKGRFPLRRNVFSTYIYFTYIYILFFSHFCPLVIVIIPQLNERYSIRPAIRLSPESLTSVFGSRWNDYGCWRCSLVDTGESLESWWLVFPLIGLDGVTAVLIWMGDRCNCESNRDKVRSLSAEIILEFTSRTAVCSSSAKLSGKGTPVRAFLLLLLVFFPFVEGNWRLARDLTEWKLCNILKKRRGKEEVSLDLFNRRD